MSVKSFGLMLVVVGLLVAMQSTAPAEVISGSGITATESTALDGSTGRCAQKLVGTDGLLVVGSGYGYETNASHMWLSNGSQAINTEWVQFNLGDAYNLDSMKIWNYNEGNAASRGLKDFTVSVSSDGISWTNLTTTFASLSKAPTNTTTAFGDTYALAQSNVQYVKINVVSNWGDGYVGLSHIEFSGTVVPEPGTLALLAAGLVGLLAYAWRKRK
jgi:hypothetical protein